ncbi:MAG: SUMF1/EgtB/PvdO family nonheme iron enzyme [Kiritimatiellae bacterium]|nr:SUMF1/EgtB/PvdO family nonheme iron enzyme [Kiritimatiellia bacterium]
MRSVCFVFAVFATFLVAVAETPLVSVNVIVATNTVGDADAAAKAVAEVAERTARADAARKRSSVVVSQLIADMKPVPGRVYLLGRTEVTAEQWHSVMKPDVPFVGKADLPVSGVSWDDCQDFIKRLNERSETSAEGLSFRLPTVKEWRHACLAGAKGKWGLVTAKTVGQLDSVGWYAGNSGSRKSAIAQKTPNVWGFYDMHGNVFEWCSDTSPEYGGDFRMRVGGSFRSPSEQCAASFANSANRQFSRYDDQGVRLICERH